MKSSKSEQLLKVSPDQGASGFAGAERSCAPEAHRSAFLPRLVQTLSRVTSSGRFIKEIDGLRFIAITAVVVYHFADLFERGSPVGRLSGAWIPIVARHGNYGVQLFFTISGFILGLPFAAAARQQVRKVSLRNYFLRRLTRLEPPYILSLFLIGAFSLLIGRMALETLVRHFAASALYVHNVLYGQPSLISTVAWSLEIEVQFYVLVPLLTLVFRIRSIEVRRLALIGTMLAIAAVQYVLEPAPGWLELSIVYYLQYFLAGFLFLDFYLISWAGVPRRVWRWDLAVIAAMGGLYLTTFDQTLARFAFPFFAVLLFCGVFRSVFANKVLTSPACTIIGGMCYTIYLYHSSVQTLLGRVTMPWVVGSSYELNFLLQFAVTSAAILGLSALHFVLIEKPCMNPTWWRAALGRDRAVHARSASGPLSDGRVDGSAEPVQVAGEHARM